VVTECEYCRRPFEQAAGAVGRPKKYCRRSCRQRAYETRRHEGDLAWGDARLVRQARDLAELEDRLDGIRALVEELSSEAQDRPELSAEAVLERLERELRSL
jgi:hypothetical protein